MKLFTHAFGSLLMMALVSVPALYSFPALGATFEYQARVAGIVAGSMKVVVERGNGRYRVTGKARSEGLWEAIDNWRADFSATGTLTKGDPTLESYELYERTNSKKQLVTVTAEVLQVTKNGKKRSPAVPLPGLDVLTALFIVASCPEKQELHTGRHGFSLAKNATLKESSTLNENAAFNEKEPKEFQCSFKVTDEDQESFVAAVKYQNFLNMNIPANILIQGSVEGILELIKVSE